MNRFLLIVQRSTSKPQFVSASSNLIKCTRMKSSSSSSGSASSSDSDTEQKNVDKDVTSKPPNQALEKLNLLLKQMINEEVQAPKSGIQLSRPEKKQKTEGEKRKVQSVEQQIVKAVKDVAEHIDGDKKQTESELLMKLLNVQEKQTETNLSDIVRGMKIDREPKTVSQKSRAEQVKDILRNVKRHTPEKQQFQGKRQHIAAKKRTTDIIVNPINLFGSPPLGIFTEKDNFKENIRNETWDRLTERDLKLAVTQPPTNYFQQMILWTEQGKIWKFPINNEQDIGDEENVCFSEHVFLDKHLEPWCPQRGPIRHFMELVCVGLSKNPYLTVEAKKEHIEWYKNYFESKKDLLREVGAIPTESKPTRQLENKTTD